MALMSVVTSSPSLSLEMCMKLKSWLVTRKLHRHGRERGAGEEGTSYSWIEPERVPINTQRCMGTRRCSASPACKAGRRPQGTRAPDGHPGEDEHVERKVDGAEGVDLQRVQGAWEGCRRLLQQSYARPWKPG